MQWIRIHPYMSALCVAFILLACGVFIVQRHGVASVTNQGGTWDGDNLGILNPTSYGSGENVPPAKEGTIMQQVQNNAPYTYTLPRIVTDTGASVGEDVSFDLNSFIAMLSQGSQTKTNSATSGNSLPSAYAFIPNGLISTTTSEDKRTETQQKIYDYGNEIGSYIQSYEGQHPAVASILKDQAEDRTDPQKAAAVEGLAQALEGVGQSLTAIEDIPSGMTSAHAALAKSYVAVGTNLALVAKAQSDTDFLHAIEVYNASADTFIKNYVTMATRFGVYDVNFSPSDAGSVFTFTPQ